MNAKVKATHHFYRFIVFVRYYGLFDLTESEKQLCFYGLELHLYFAQCELSLIMLWVHAL